MGTKPSTVTERTERAAKTGVLTLSDLKITSWKKLISRLSNVQSVKTISLDHNALSKSIPRSFMTLHLWKTLVSVDLSHNNITCACVLGSGGASHASPDECAAASSATVSQTSEATSGLETLNLSGNALSVLPANLAARFPSLKRIVCKDNRRPLNGGSLAACLRQSKSMESVNLSNSGLTSVVLLKDEKSMLPSMKELILSSNNFKGTFSLTETQIQKSVFPSLRRVVLDAPKDTLSEIDPNLYTNAPDLNSLSLVGHGNEEKLMEKLRSTAGYQRWRENHVDQINRQLQSTGEAKLMS